MEYNKDKIIDVVAKFIQLEGGKLNYLKLMKYLYLLEKHVMVQYGYSISNDRFVSMEHGPVLSHTLDLIRDRSFGDDKELWDEFIERDGYNLSLSKQPDYKSLSENELGVINQLFETHKDKNKYQLRDYVHEHCPEWKPTTSSLPLEIEDILRSADLEEDDITDKIHEIEDASFLFNFK